MLKMDRLSNGVMLCLFVVVSLCADCVSSGQLLDDSNYHSCKKECLIKVVEMKYEYINII